jgi:hypothetical protein
MVGTRETVSKDSFTAGPDNCPDILKLGMKNGDILIGKDRQGYIRAVFEQCSENLINITDDWMSIHRKEPQ